MSNNEFFAPEYVALVRCRVWRCARILAMHWLWWSKANVKDLFTGLAKDRPGGTPRFTSCDYEPFQAMDCDAVVLHQATSPHSLIRNIPSLPQILDATDCKELMFNSLVVPRVFSCIYHSFSCIYDYYLELFPVHRTFHLENVLRLYSSHYLRLFPFENGPWRIFAHHDQCGT